MSRPRSPRTTLVSAVAANFGQFGARVAISPFVLVIALDFGVSTTEIGAVLTLMWVTYALLQFPSGVLADRYGERTVMLAALAVTALGSFLVTLSSGFWLFAGAALLLGAGSGLYFVVGTALLSRRFERTGSALGVHSAGGPLAGLVLPVLATTVAATHGWQAGVATGGVVAAGAFVLVLVGVGPTPARNPNARLGAGRSLDVVRGQFARPGVAFTMVIGFVGMYVFQSFTSFFPAFLQAHHGLTETRSGQVFGLAFLLIAVGLPLVGAVADRRDIDLGIAVPMLVTAVGFGVLLVPAAGPTFVNVPASVLLGSVVVGVGLTWGGALQARAMTLFAADDRGTGFGLMRTIYVLLGASGNLVTGALAESVGWAAAFGVVAGWLVVGAVLLAANRAFGFGM